MSVVANARVSAAYRVSGVMGRALGVGGLVFTALELHGLLAQISDYLSWWTGGVLLSFVGSLVLLLFLSGRASPAGIRRGAGAVSLSFLLGMVTLIPALAHGELSSPGRPWLVGVLTIGAAAAAVAWPAWFAWTYLGVATLLTLVDCGVANGSPDWIVPVQESLFGVFFGAVFVALAMATRRAGDALDAAAEGAISEVKRVAAASAHERERGRIDALIHDSILVALLASAAGGARADAARQQASRALEEIRSFGAPRETSQMRSPVDCIWDLQAIATELAPEATFTYVVEGNTDIPTEVVLAVCEAAAEALRNSVLHADPKGGFASRSFHTQVGPEGLNVTILDDGVGFDAESVAPTRLGISVGILGRMNGQPGGFANVLSQRGIGTRVSLRWQRS